MKKRGSIGLIIQDRRSQITAFILLGVVLLILISMIFMATSSVKQQQVEKQIDIAAEKLVETNILRGYVTLCLKDSLQEGLVFMGKQGGRIYAGQGGFIEDDGNYVEYSNYKISYGIDASILGPIASGAELPEPPEYPCVNKPDTISYPCDPTPYNSLLNPRKNYPFGRYNLPALCDPEGPNSANLNIFPYPCPTGTYGEDSIQEQLNQFISAKLSKCLDAERIKSIENITQMRISVAIPNVSVIFGEEDVYANATFPLNMSVGKYSATRMFGFQSSLPVRFKKMFGLADFIAKSDVYYLDFNAEHDYGDYKYFNKELLPVMNVKRIKMKDDTDIIEINDSISIIEGKPYVFRFAVKDRIPALEPIPAPRQAEGSFDIVVKEGSTITITPRGYDADEKDTLNYGFTGWKADEDAEFNPERCFSGENYARCRSDPYFSVDIKSNGPQAWQQGTSTYKTGTKDDANHIEYPAGCDPGINCRYYSKDLGAHNLTVKVCDNAGKCDFQVVNILVTDEPMPVVRTKSFLPGLADNIATVEDPFVLDSSESCIFCAYSSYTWRDEWGSTGSDFSFDVPSADMPDPENDGKITLPGENPDIESITQEENMFKTAVSGHTLTLTIMGVDSSPKIIDVKNCTAFMRHAEVNKDTASYPYNNLENPYYYTEPNPFLADHACCENNQFIEKNDLNNPCYTYISYGSFKSFDPNRLRLGPMFIDTVLINKTKAMSKDMENDIFKRTFTRYCSGDRGNMCSGDAIETIENKTRCPDFDDNAINVNYDVAGSKPNAAAKQKERCQGVNPVFIGQESTSIVNTCSIFTRGKTFESEFGLGGTGKCSDTPACSSGEGDNVFGAGGPFMCTYAQCDGDSLDMDGKHCDYGVGCACSISCGSSADCAGLTYAQAKEGGGRTLSGGRKVYCSNECQLIDPDTNQDACYWVNDKTSGDDGKAFNADMYFDTGLKKNCCGDDDDEYYRVSADGKQACCNSQSDCVINGQCISSGTKGAGPLNSKQKGVCVASKKMCSNGGWEDDYSGISSYEGGAIETRCGDGIDNNCDGTVDNGCASR